MRVSVVTTSFNQAPFLARAIESVLAQDYPDVEYIVVDAGSTDSSREVIEHYRDRIDRVILEPDRGHGDGMNKGLRLATGDLYLCINSDDALLPGAITEAVREFEQTPWADVIYAHGYIIDAAGRVKRRFISERWNTKRFVRTPQAIMHQATFYRAEAFWAVEGYDITRRFAKDSDLLVRMALAGRRFRRVSGYWGLFAVHPTSGTGNPANDAAWERARELMFELVMGRPRGSRDRIVLDRMARMVRWLTDPRGRAVRLYEVIFGVPRMMFPLAAPPAEAA